LRPPYVPIQTEPSGSSAKLVTTPWTSPSLLSGAYRYSGKVPTFAFHRLTPEYVPTHSTPPRS
jgi:hypothetical protein